MNFEEIKTKYAADSAMRIARRKTLQSAVDMAQAKVDKLGEEIEQLRPMTGMMPYEDVDILNSLRFLHNEAGKALKQAQSDLQAFEAEGVDIDEIAKAITH